MRGHVLTPTFRREGCAAAQHTNHPIDPMPALTILGIKYPFPRDLERQATVFDEVGRQDTHVMPSTIEIAREFAYPYRSDDIRRRERKADDQNFHLGGGPARISIFGQ